jgi:metal-responsive CopG/Arc/MetJ family transcriptional regulator
MTEEKKSRSGTSRSYAERMAKGRPNVTISLPTETIELLSELQEHHGLSRSAVIDLAVREFAKKRR